MAAPKGIARVIPNRAHGRPKGVPNKITSDIRQMIVDVVDKIGGAERMLQWAQSSPEAEKAFWTVLVPRILPKEINIGGQADNPLNLGLKVTFVDPVEKVVSEV